MFHQRLKGAIYILMLLAAPAAYAQGPKQQSTPEVATTDSASYSKREYEALRRQLNEQQMELQRLRSALEEQTRQIDELRKMVVHQSAPKSPSAEGINSAPSISVSDSADTATPSPARAPQDVNTRIAVLETEVKKTAENIKRQLGSISISGDVRLRYDALYGLLNPLPNGLNPSVLGNELTTRQRLRVRARLNIQGRIGREFELGIRLSSGSYSDTAVPNQTLTDFFNRKPFGLDNAYIAYSPRKLPGLRIQAGKFDVPWLRTEMTIDNDLSPEGVNETYSRGFKKSGLKNITFVAWQLPFLERNSAFIRNADGTVNIDESRRAGRDLALYGAQVRARLEPTKNSSLTIALADLYYSGTQFISPLQFFGNQIQIPVVVNIPATQTTPAQTVTAQALIPRELLVAGSANLGVTTASNNAVNRDGRLSSGFNLLDLIVRLELARDRRFPVTFILDFVTNTQAQDIVVAAPDGSDLLLPNKERNGYWGEIQVGKQMEKGDLLFGYTFMRIEKDAVLTPFNFSELVQQSDARVQRFVLTYTVDPKVVLSLIGFYLERPNGLLGAFGQTPPGSLQRPTTRIQFDTTFRF